MSPASRTLKLNALKSTSRRQYATTTTTIRYPFPDCSEPTPYQIFHLPPGTPANEVKDRYYELVKLYHPDSVDYRQRQPDPAVRHAQFKAITAAYKTLTKGKTPVNGAAGFEDEHEAVRRAYRRREQLFRSSRGPVMWDERWKERAIWAGLGLALLTAGAQYVTLRQKSVSHVYTRIRHLPKETEGEES